MLVTMTHDGDYAMAQAMLVGDEETAVLPRAGDSGGGARPPA